jgi:hypothetical protein
MPDFGAISNDTYRANPAVAQVSGAGLTLEEARRFYRWSHRLTSTLVRLRDVFDGDLDRYLLHSVFVQAEMQRSLAPRGNARGLNALSLSDITRIPRETTRRKLKLLAESGFLRQGPDGLHYLADRYPQARFLDDLAPLFEPAEPPAPAAEPSARSWKPLRRA